MKRLVSFVMCAALLVSLSSACSRQATPDEEPAAPASATEAPAVTGVTYYVATDGDDSNPGTLESPWRSIQHAADTLQAGDGVQIRGGTYHEHVRTANSGTEEDYIVFAAYPGERPIVDGTGVVESQNGFIVSDSHVKLHGLTVRNWGETGIWIENAAYVEIADCEVHDVAFGIGVADGTHDFLFRNVLVHDFDLYGFDVSPSGGAECYNGTFIDCVAHTGRDPEQNVDGFALGHGEQHTFTFTRCVTHDVYDGFDISADDVTLDRCLAYDCGFGGYKLWGDDITVVNSLSYGNSSSNVELDWSGEPKTVTLRNCTFFGGETYNIWVENADDSLHMYNCILAGNGNIGLAFEQPGVGNYRGDHNLFHNNDAERAVSVAYAEEFSLSRMSTGAWTEYSGQDANSVVLDNIAGLFVDPEGLDFHLDAGSPAIDAGAPAHAPSKDYDDNTRPADAGPDIGAYESR